MVSSHPEGMTLSSLMMLERGGICEKLGSTILLICLKLRDITVLFGCGPLTVKLRRSDYISCLFLFLQTSTQTKVGEVFRHSEGESQLLSQLTINGAGMSGSRERERD